MPFVASSENCVHRSLRSARRLYQINPNCSKILITTSLCGFFFLFLLRDIFFIARSSDKYQSLIFMNFDCDRLLLIKLKLDTTFIVRVFLVQIKMSSCSCTLFQLTDHKQEFLHANFKLMLHSTMNALERMKGAPNSRTNRFKMMSKNGNISLKRMWPMWSAGKDGYNTW